MRVDVDHEEDIYVYDVYYFEFASVCYVARSYETTAHEAHFLRKQWDGEKSFLTAEDLDSPEFCEAVAYLRSRGMTELHYLSTEHDGYAPVTT